MDTSFLRPGPFSYGVRDFTAGGLRVESDGYSAVAFPGDVSELKRRTDLDAMLWPDCVRLAPLDLSALREWLSALVPEEPQPVLLQVRCDACGGTGKQTEVCRSCGHEHEHECEDCDGQGTVDEAAPKLPEITAKLLGACFDARRLAPAIKALPGAEARWARVDEDAHAPLLIVGDDWRYVLMPMLPGHASTPPHAWPEVLP